VSSAAGAASAGHPLPCGPRPASSSWGWTAPDPAEGAAAGVPSLGVPPSAPAACPGHEGRPPSITVSLPLAPTKNSLTVPHELTDPGLPEEPLQVVRDDPPVDGEVNGPFPVLPVIEGHQVPEGEAPSGSLGPDILSGETPVG
jgi:hypothetical protein